MKPTINLMKKTLSVVFLSFCAVAALAQGTLTQPPNGDNQKASVTQWIGPVSVTITYNSPDVHGPSGEDRTDHIWGELVHYGFIDQGFGVSKAAPWRAGSNENTTISFSHDVKINGKDLKAGTYGLFLDVEKDKPWQWIFSKNSTSWGSYSYDAKEDALRAETTPEDAPYKEWLTYGFDDRKPSSTRAYLRWEKKLIPMNIEVPNINDLYVSIMRNELRNSTGFDYRNYATAAQFCAQNKTNLDEALTWADLAISMPFIGVEDFSTLQTKSMVLAAMNKNAEAEAVMTKAINHPTANVQAVHQYGRSLLAEGKNEKALEVFKVNKQKHPEDNFTTFVGLARGYSAVGDKKNAIKNWELAIKNIPENQKGNLPTYQAELKKLKG
jgi:tetratricopeptide (TPR) repeat protein